MSYRQNSQRILATENGYWRQNQAKKERQRFLELTGDRTLANSRQKKVKEEQTPELRTSDDRVSEQTKQTGDRRRNWRQKEAKKKKQKSLETTDART
ncbi:hypothetical protein U1Q18_007699 [Sarracenia purpurea var. burkii]